MPPFSSLQTAEAQFTLSDAYQPADLQARRRAHLPHLAVPALVYRDVEHIFALACLACKGIAAAAGIEVVVLSLLGLLDTVSAIRMLGIGLACLAISQLPTEGP